MEKLSATKRVAIVRDYLSALPYSKIADKQHVSTGAVANVVAELKAGEFPEVGAIGEQVEQLKELSLDLKRANLTPGRCALGLMVLARIKECGLEPADIDRWPLILKSVKNEQEAQQFVGLINGILEVQHRTGLTLEALYDKANDLEKKAAELQVVSNNISIYNKQMAELNKRKGQLTTDVANLEERYKQLVPQVSDLEKREGDLSRRLAEMQPKAQKAEATLANLGKESQKLQKVGFTFEELTEFSERVKAIAERHGIAPAKLRSRLQKELESLDKGLGLETLINARQQELEKQKQLVVKANQEVETTRTIINSLKQEKTKLEASIKTTRERVSLEIAQIIPVARDTVTQLEKELRSEVDNAVAEVGKLRDMSLEAGKAVGRFEVILETNVWLKELLSLMGGEPGIEDRRVKAIMQPVERGFYSWLKLKMQGKPSLPYAALSNIIGDLIKELERWDV